MSSLKMTFSLASLVILFAMVFVPTSVMAAAGGPTVTISDGGTTMTPSTRTSFQVKFVFDIAVTGFEGGATNKVTASLYNKAGQETDSSADVASILAVPDKPAEYTTTITMRPADGDVGLVVTVAADAATGNLVTSDKHSIPSQPRSKTFPLKAIYPNQKVVIMAKKDADDTDETNGQVYDLTFTFKKLTEAPGEALTADFVNVAPSFVNAPVTIDDANMASDPVGDWVYTGTLTYPVDAPELTITLAETYVAAKNVTSTTIPPAPPPDPPMVAITVTNHVPAERSFRVDVALTPAAGSKDITDFGHANLDIKDADEVALKFTEIAGTLVAERPTKNAYTAILKYGLLDKLPLTVTTHKDYKVANTVAPTAYVGDPPPVVDPPVVDPPVVDPPVVDPPVVDPPVVDPPVVTPPVVTPPVVTPPVVTPPVTTTPGALAFSATSIADQALTAGTAISTGTGTTAMPYIPLPVATGGGGDYTYTLRVGAGKVDVTTTGHNGLSVDLINLRLSGTPTIADATGSTGTMYTWRVTDGDGEIAELTFMVTVAAGSVPPTLATAITITAKSTNLASLRIATNNVANTDVGPNQSYYEFTLSSATAIGNFNSAIQVNGVERWAVQPTVTPMSWTLQIWPNTFGSFDRYADVQARSGYKLQTTDPTDSTKLVDISRVWILLDREGPSIKSITLFSPLSAEGGPFFVRIHFDDVLKAAPTAANFTVVNGVISDITVLAVEDMYGRSIYSAKITPNAGVGADNTDATEQKVEIRLNAGLLDKYDNASVATAAYTVADASYAIRKSKAPGPVPPTPGDVTATKATAADVTTVTLKGSIAANGFATIGSASLPNLEEFFTIGGTIGVDDGDATDDKNSRSVVVSEILWGLDYGETDIAKQNKHQFIELYNTTAAAIDLTGWKLIFTGGRPVPKSDIDQVSNRSGAGWDVNIGQSGRVTNTTADGGGTSAPLNIVSMYRKINYTKVEKVKADGTADPSRAEQLKGIPGANGPDNWAPSIRASANGIFSSKGRKHFETTAVLTASAVAGTPFRINEIGNDTGSDNDWVELHNVTNTEQSLKDYQLTQVTAKGTDTELFDFEGQDWKVAKKGFVVISTRHPRDTDLAAGKDISIADDQEENVGATHLFVVKPVNIQDDGKVTLILRNAHNKQKANSDLIDVVSTRDGSFADDTRGTSIWPLKATSRPHENVIDGTGDEDFRAGKVYQRNGGNGRGDKSFAVRGYTGVGYDRAAAATGANGGTPGYDNGAVKGKIAELSAASVTISEIMVDVGDGRQNLAQWIELYNSSMTQAVTLGGWKLAIENASDVETALSATLALDGMTISPNQTVLIVSTSGRTSDPDHFPSSRVVNLWTTKKHRDELEMERRTAQVFSATGFHFKLTDADNKFVDEAGNLDGIRRTRDDLTTTWAIPTGLDDDRRSSLIRVYDDGVAVNGTLAAGWVSADATNLAFAISETYFGDPDDFGTPGFRGGGPLPVSLSKFRPELLDSGEIVVRWITESELNNAGFNILRSETRNGEFTQLNTKLIAGQGTTSERTVYSFPDTSAKPNVAYYYQIQDVSIDGKVQTLRQSRIKGYVSPSGKLTTTWGELKALQ